MLLSHLQTPTFYQSLSFECDKNEGAYQPFGPKKKKKEIAPNEEPFQL